MFYQHGVVKIRIYIIRDISFSPRCKYLATVLLMRTFKLPFYVEIIPYP